MSQYGLPDHVFVCLNDEYVVILDLKRDRYFALQASRTAGLSTLVRGWPVPLSAGARSEAASPEETNATAQVLLRQGLLSNADTAAKDATPVQLPAPAKELVVQGDTHGTPIRAGAIAAFLAASIFAKFALRFWTFERVIRRVQLRKRARATATQPLDVERAPHLVDSFARLRVFLFSSRDECLYDSLALLEFLARGELFPDWVFAVRARPFAAHCWVQYGDIVFNDRVEEVGGYTPIMVV